MAEGKKVLMIIAHKNFRDEELSDTKQVVENAGALVTIASTELTPATGMFGAVAQPHVTIDQVSVDEYDAIVFVGGGGSQIYFENPTALNIARESHAKNKVLGAICIAPGILANADVLRGKKATVWGADYAEHLKAKGALYTGEAVTRDGNLITANGPQAAKAFGEMIVNALG